MGRSNREAESYGWRVDDIEDGKEKDTVQIKNEKRKRVVGFARPGAAQFPQPPVK